MSMAHFTDYSTATVVLDIRGMTCSACEKHVGEALASVPGVSALEVSRNPGSATIEWETGVPDLTAVVDAVRTAGYDAVVSRVSGEMTMPAAPPRAAAPCCCGSALGERALPEMRA
jgi:copper chaperone CopZ